MESVDPNALADDLEELEGDAQLDVVQLDGLVVLRIIKHCHENLPDLVTGQLLGLDVGATLEVTNSFPFPNRADDLSEEDADTDSAEYQLLMMRCLREVNVDYYTVGWYQSTYLGSFLNVSLIETQYNYQTTIKKCVVVVYDPLRSTQGNLSLKAYRLTPTFMNLFQNQTFSQETLAKSNLSFNDIFEQVPIQIHNSNLVNAFLYELQDTFDLGKENHALLGVSSNSFLEKNLEFLIEGVDDLQVEQSRLQYYQRIVARQQYNLNQWLQKRKQENAQRRQNGEEELSEEPPEELTRPIQGPKGMESRLWTLLITTQIQNYCTQIDDLTGPSSSKLYLLSKLQEDSKDK